MTADLYLRFHHAAFDLRQRPTPEAVYLQAMPEICADDLARLMAQRNANVRARRKPGATILTRIMHKGAPIWTPQPLERN